MEIPSIIDLATIKRKSANAIKCPNCPDCRRKGVDPEKFCNLIFLEASGQTRKTFCLFGSSVYVPEAVNKCPAKNCPLYQGIKRKGGL
jgi:hypothetical protein